MISRLTGTIAHIDLRYLVVDVGGVGYKVFATSDTIAGTKLGGHLSLFTYLAVRDDAMDLYGFSSAAELGFFELLIGVSGIGPKTALGVLNAASIATLEMAIESNDTSHLTKVSGIGKKNAEKIVLELRDKIGAVISARMSAGEDSATNGSGGTGSAAGAGRSPEHIAAMRGDSDVIEALKALGYRESESRDALKKISKSSKDTGARIKEALRELNK